MATAKKSTAKKLAAKKATPKRMGRPPKPEGERREARLGLRLHESERAELEAAAVAYDTTVTQIVVDAVREKRARDRR